MPTLTERERRDRTRNLRRAMTHLNRAIELLEAEGLEELTETLIDVAVDLDDELGGEAE